MDGVESLGGLMAALLALANPCHELVVEDEDVVVQLDLGVLDPILPSLRLLQLGLVNGG